MDEMLGRYRDYSIGQAGAIEQVRVFLFALFPYLMGMHMSGKGIRVRQVGDGVNKHTFKTAFLISL